MLAQLINHSQDLKRLWDQGLVMNVKEGYLIIDRVPYLNSKKEVSYGTLISKLQVSGNKTIDNPEHTVYFTGEMPCRLDGSPFTSILLNSDKQIIADRINVNHRFSSKPKPNGYRDYYHKMTTYINILSGPAKAIDNTITEKGNQMVSTTDQSPFQYMDTNSNKPELSSLTKPFAGQKIGIIGLGGTGSYILDLVSKVPVSEIHLHDGDWFYNNNAFKAPGAAKFEDLKIPKKKVEYFESLYSKIHKGVKVHPHYISHDNIDELSGYSFVFLSVDSGEIKKEIIKSLERLKIPFIDVGMGVYNNKGGLTGLLRVTSGFPDKTDHIWNSGNVPFTDGMENEYDSNIQIAELNSLNAALAVIRWKRYLGYYHDRANESSMFYRINSNRLANE